MLFKASIKVLAAGSAMLIVGCASNPHKAEKIETAIEKKQRVGNDQAIGVKDGNMVYQKKLDMAEELRSLETDVFETEDKVYGNRKYGSQGMYGVLKECRLKLSSKDLGGDGKLKYTEPVNRVTEKEEEFNIGLDENEKIVGVSEEFLKDRIFRFQKYKLTLQKREDEFQEKIDICNAEVSARKVEVQKTMKSE
jgi:hypothetical protein